jgi:cyclic pyranopterin monophosphate synthase
MVDVGAKPASRRRAVARAFVSMAPESAAQLGSLPKGDALTTAQLAGIMAAKRTAELIPLCHPLPVVDVRLSIEESGVAIEASAETTAQTGVEMEALTAAAVAALTIYDMAKAIDKGMVVTEVRLLEKTKE